MPSDQAFQKLLETGILGAFVVLLVIAVVFLYRENQKVRDNRLADLREVWQKDMELRKEIKYLLDNILRLLQSKEG